MSIVAQRRPHSAKAPLRCRDVLAALLSRPLLGSSRNKWLSELEQDLGDERFIRIHRSIVVSLDRIRGLELQASGEYEVVLKSKVRLRLSRRYRKQLQDRLGAMSGHG
jgi:hypothetical protein